MSKASRALAGIVLITVPTIAHVDGARLPEKLRWVARLGIAAAPILMPLGFFLSVLSPAAQSPSPLLALVYAGAGCLAVGVVTLGVGLVRARTD